MFDILANPRRLEEQVVALEQQPVQTGKILFYGDDVFACWDGILEDRSEYVCHGLNGATAEDLLYYYGRLVRPYKPKVLVISFGYSDFGYKKWDYSPEEIMANLTRLCHWAKTDFPGIQILLTEQIPWLEFRWYGGDREDWVGGYHIFRRLNELTRLFAQTTENVHVLTLWDKEVFFETPEDVGKPRKIRQELYEEDDLHFNAAGYEVMAEILRPAVAEVLNYV